LLYFFFVITGIFTSLEERVQCCVVGGRQVVARGLYSQKKSPYHSYQVLFRQAAKKI